MKRVPIPKESWDSPHPYYVRHCDPDHFVDRIYLNHFVRYREGCGRAAEWALELLGGHLDRWFERYPDYYVECAKKADFDMTMKEWEEQ